MWNYEKETAVPGEHLTAQTPPWPRVIMSQLGGPDGELAASMRYSTSATSCPMTASRGRADGHRHRGVGPPGDHQRHPASADPEGPSIDEMEARQV